MALSEYKCTKRCIIAFWVTMVQMVIILTILTIILFWLFCNFYVSSSKCISIKSEMKKISRFFKLTCITSIIWGIMSVICDFIHIYYGYSLPLELHQGTFKEIRAFADFAMFASLLTFYVYLYGQLRKAFEGTMFKTTNSFKIFVSLIFIIIIILNVCYTALVLTDFNTKFNSNNTFCDAMHGIVYGMFTWFYMLLFFSIIFTFIYKLRQLTIHSYNISNFSDDSVLTNNGRYSLNTTPSNTGSSFDITIRRIERRQSIGNHPGTHIDELIGIVTKHAVLSLFAFILFCSRFIYRHVIGTYYDENGLSEIMWMVSYLWRDIVLLSNTFVMYLGFHSNKKQYNMCCKGCDKICRSICVWSMDRKHNEMQLKKIEKRASNNSLHLNDVIQIKQNDDNGSNQDGDAATDQEVP